MRNDYLTVAAIMITSAAVAAPLVFSDRLDATPAGSEPRVIRTADMDGDGDVDAVLTCSVDTEVTVMLNDGSGAFADEPFDAGFSSWGMDLGDLDADGDIDVVIAGGGSGERRVKVFLNRGDASFDAGPTLLGGSFGVAVAVVDVDGDGDLDVASLANVSGGVSIFLNDGSAAFVPGQGVLGTYSPHGTGIASGDVDGDGVADLLVSHYDGVTVLLGQGNGTFLQSGAAGVAVTTDDVALGDIDGDGFLDAASALIYGNSVAVRYNNGDGTFGALRTLAVSGSGLIKSVSLADLNGDGRAEVIANNEAYGAVSVFVNAPGRTFEPEQRFTAATQPAVVFAADVNHDEKPDLLVACRNFGDEPVLSRFLNLTEFPAVCAGDVNGDGVVNFSDLNAVLAAFGQEGSASGDGNGDGVVDFADLNLVLSRFGTSCE